jgi:uncharacterized protein YraI
MGQYTRRLLAGPLLALAVGGGLVMAPATAEAATPGVDATVQVRSSLMVRSGPSLSAASLRSLHNGDKVTAICAVDGPEVRGSVRTTTRWDKLSDGTYITDAYVWSTAPIPKCATKSPQAQAVQSKPITSAGTSGATSTVKYKVGTVRSADGKVNVRTGPSTTAPVKRTVLTGAKVYGVCGVVGTLVNGTVRSTTQWDRLTDGGYISHAYVITPTLHLCPGASTTPASSGDLTPAQFLAAAVPGAQAGWRQYGVPASVTIAQAILESGWGHSSLSTIDRNYFGKAGTCFATTAAFRTYATMSHSIRDHGNFLKVNSRYKPAFTYTKDANKFIWQVWKAGYATDPNYYTKVTSLMASQKLYQYDIWK